MKKSTFQNQKTIRTKPVAALSLKWFSLIAVPALLLFFSTSIIAQEAINLETALTSKAPATQQVLKSLVFDVHPTICVENGTIKTFGNGPAVRLETDSKSFSSLYDADPIFDQVEIITVKLNNPDDMKVVPLNLQNLTGFTRLKYILFLCNMNCNPNSINKMFKATTQDGFEIFYQVSIPN
ncbi:MAG TPA: hypothetical protein PLI16_10440 [Bacteroidales bacterium]|jgi:hypothetical protein|nr:hypothetical protein [Bacteroidales bacterium]HNZ42632.1 hypothetical protein [Bacteroidales bacterium]HOH85018.1 hypothetical protein [Bacteroidales bacterium]HPB24578.1 hypothetical protein [Bacteroidales bacterium]HPI29395.1 hypothetical protein [Bacteroidales bacterium]